jgi:hypothetical protein
MYPPPRRSWAPLLLFWLTLAAAAALILLVFLSPLLDNGQARPQGWARWLAVFARDGALRRTALASAACLTVTAYVFFRPPAGRRSSRNPRRPPPANIAGA